MIKRIIKFLIKLWDKIDDFVLELGRVALIAALPVIYLSLEAGKIDWNAIWLACFIAVLRAIDRWLHEKGITETGLVPF